MRREDVISRLVLRLHLSSYFGYLFPFSHTSHILRDLVCPTRSVLTSRSPSRRRLCMSREEKTTRSLPDAWLGLEEHSKKCTPIQAPQSILPVPPRKRRKSGGPSPSQTPISGISRVQSPANIVLCACDQSITTEVLCHLSLSTLCLYFLCTVTVVAVVAVFIVFIIFVLLLPLVPSLI